MATDALEQAEYFYRRMGETSKIPSEFRSNTNAFIASGRNITWVLQKEFSKSAKFQSWYAQEQNEMRNDELMSFFNQARAISVKEHPLRPSTVTYIRHLEIDKAPEGIKNPGFEITAEGEVVWTTKNEEGKKERIHASEFDSEIAVQYYFENPRAPQPFANLQVIDLCGLYLFALRDLVKEALESVRE